MQIATHSGRARENKGALDTGQSYFIDCYDNQLRYRSQGGVFTLDRQVWIVATLTKEPSEAEVGRSAIADGRHPILRLRVKGFSTSEAVKVTPKPRGCPGLVCGETLDRAHENGFCPQVGFPFSY